MRQSCRFDWSLTQRRGWETGTRSWVLGMQSCSAQEKRDPFKMWRTISDGQASGSTVCHDTPHVLKVREGALRFALCDRLHVPSHEHTTMTHAAMQLTGQRERSPDSDLPPVRKGEEQNSGVREAEDVGGMEVQDLQELVASQWPRSSLRLPNMEERGAFRKFLCAGCQTVPGDRGHGCRDLAGILAREGNSEHAQDFCKPYVPGDTSFMHPSTQR